MARPLAVLRLSADGVVLAANEAAEALLGPCVGRTCDQVVCARGSDRQLWCRAGCGRALAAGETPSREARRVTVGGQPVRLICAAADDAPTVVIVEEGEAVPEPRAPLSPGEAAVLAHVARGLTDAEIAAALGVQPSTVKTQLARARDKLGARTRAEAVALALRAGDIA